MSEIGKPLERWEVVPLSEPVAPTREPEPTKIPEKAPEREHEPA